MSIALIGLIFAALAGAALLHSSKAAFAVVATASLFQAAAAMKFGGGNIQPGHLALGFFALAIIIRQGGLSATLSSVKFPRAGLWFAIATFWAVITGYAMPRLFAGQFEIIPMNLVYGLSPTATYPLYPASSNINQSVYAIGNLVAFMAVVGMCRSHGLLRAGAIGMLVAVAVNLFMVVVDQVTFAIGRASMLDFIRNAEYGQLYHAKAFGIKRITSTFPESSTYATAAMGLMAFCLRLWRGGVMPKYAGPMAAAMGVTIILSTSTTAYVALAGYLIVVYSFAAMGIDPARPRGPLSGSRRGFFLWLGPGAGFMLIAMMAFRPDMFSGISNFFNHSVLEKLNSSSGAERTVWNMNGLKNIVDSYGLGAGLGSVRTSSYLISLFAQTGVLGAFLMGMFLLRLFQPGKAQISTRLNHDSHQIAAAARSGCFGILLASIASAATADLGILFFLFAGLANAAVFQQTARDQVGGPIMEFDELPNGVHGDVHGGVPAE